MQPISFSNLLYRTIILYRTIMEFTNFVERVANGLGLQPCWATDKKSATTMRTNKNIHANFSDFTLTDDNQCYNCEVFDDDGNYLGTIEWNDGYIEHFEYGVSPFGLYDSKTGNPLNEQGFEIDGELQVYWRGTSIKCACNSLLKGGAKRNRKPIKTY